jgi:hypothetical protein
MNETAKADGLERLPLEVAEVSVSEPSGRLRNVVVLGRVLRLHRRNRGSRDGLENRPSRQPAFVVMIGSHARPRAGK